VVSDGDIELSLDDRFTLISELALLYQTDTDAGGLLDRLQFPRGRRPIWSGTTEQWWAQVFNRFDVGIVAEPVRRVLLRGTSEFPNNRVLRQLAEDYGVTSPARAAGGVTGGTSNPKAPLATFLPPTATPAPASQRASSVHGRRVFLSYAEPDKDAARHWHGKLTADGVPAWLYAVDLPPGSPVDYSIDRRIRDAAAFVVFLSAASVRRPGYAQKEIVRALEVAQRQPEGAMYIFPARLNECDIPDRLRDWREVDLFTPTGYSSLLAALRTVI